MPLVKVWCLPPDQTEDRLRDLHKSIVEKIVGIQELGFRDETDITVLFIPDLMKYGLGTEIIIEIDGLFQKRGRAVEVINRLAESVGKLVTDFYPETGKVECLVHMFRPALGFWSSEGSSWSEEE